MDEGDSEETAGVFGIEVIIKLSFRGEGDLRQRKCLRGLAGNPVLMIYFGIKVCMKWFVFYTFTHIIS